MSKMDKHVDCGEKRSQAGRIAAAGIADKRSRKMASWDKHRFRTRLVETFRLQRGRLGIDGQSGGQRARRNGVRQGLNRWVGGAVLVLTVAGVWPAALASQGGNQTHQTAGGQTALAGGRAEAEAPSRARAHDPHNRRRISGNGAPYGEPALVDVREVQIARVISWRKGRMVVTDEPLLSVIDEMNRNSKRKLKVDRSDPRLRKLLVTGQFRVGRPELIVEYLRAAGIQVWVTKDGDGNITLRLRGDSSRS